MPSDESGSGGMAVATAADADIVRHLGCLQLGSADNTSGSSAYRSVKLCQLIESTSRRSSCMDTWPRSTHVFVLIGPSSCTSCSRSLQKSAVASHRGPITCTHRSHQCLPGSHLHKDASAAHPGPTTCTHRSHQSLPWSHLHKVATAAHPGPTTCIDRSSPSHYQAPLPAHTGPTSPSPGPPAQRGSCCTPRSNHLHRPVP